MINGKLISIGEIIWKIMRNPLAQDISKDQISEFIVEFMRLLQAPLTLSNIISEPLQLTDYKAYLPSNMLTVRGVRYLGLDGCCEPVSLRYASDIYHNSQNDNNCNPENTYVLQDCVLISSVKDGYVEIAYNAISVDEDGYPLIPDNESYKLALEYYCLYKIIEPLWMMGKIQDKVFHYISQERHFYFGQAENSTKLQGIDQLETMMNAINRLVIQNDSHSNGYKNIGRKERIKKYH